jgi:hypothetical protein
MEWIDYNSKYNQSCRDCAMRHVGCHSKCGKYKIEKELRTKERRGLIREHENQMLNIYKENGRKRRIF